MTKLFKGWKKPPKDNAGGVDEELREDAKASGRVFGKDKEKHPMHFGVKEHTES